MTRKVTRDELEDIHEHPAFRGLVDDLAQGTSHELTRAMEYLADEQRKEDENGDSGKTQ